MVAVAIPLIMVLCGLTKRGYGLFFEPHQSEFSRMPRPAYQRGVRPYSSALICRRKSLRCSS